MGASQSSNNGGGTASQEIKTSYYELLGVDRQANDDDIKKAYKKAALRLHPDRNYGNEEAATKTFAEVSAAYEVLSDPQERAWYDSHESAILRGDDATDGDVPMYENVRVTTADDLARLLRKFNKNVEFSDSPSGFFGFLRETFEQLAKEEEIAANMENAEVREYPTFGHKDDQYDDVVKQFYNFWSSFSTMKSFSWKDQYRLSEAPDRWYRRRMESENNRLRQEGKREFNEAVRSLVAFVKKRDPRYVPNSQTEAERQKVLREATAAQAARARAANEAKMSAAVPEWTKVREPEDDELDESEEEVEEQVFECVACDKIFKSEKQWEAHEKSKKHQKAVRALQKQMRKDNAGLDLDVSGVSTPDVDEHSEPEEIADDDVNEGGMAEFNGHYESQHHNEVEDDGQQDADTDDAAEMTKPETAGEDVQDVRPDDRTSSEDDDYAPIETIQARMEATTLDKATQEPGSDSDSKANDTKPRKGKAAQKRAKKAAAAAASATTEQDDAALLHCEVCRAGFPSKNKLFEHIKVEGHAAFKADVGGGSKGGKKKKGKR